MAKRDLQGRVEGVNDNGVKIAGTWYNFSNFFKGERSPERGVMVSAEISDFKGREYLNKLAVIGSALSDGGGNAPQQSYSGGGSYGTKDRDIRRQVALKASVERYSHDGSADSALIVSLARQFEAYLNEPFVDASVEDAA